MFLDSLQLLGLNLLPQRTVSRLVGSFAHSPASKHLIPFFAKKFDIDVTQAERPLEDYATLNEFFTRRLKPELRPIDSAADSIVSPVDGRVSASGKIKAGRLWQIKGIDYSLLDLVNGDREKAERFTDGEFVTIYLSPQDYHRIHMPLGGRLVEVSYIPGALFPVNPFAVRTVTSLFARNERLITYADTKAGMMGVVKVGATMVGSVKVVYGDDATNLRHAKPYRRELETAPRLAKGDELGRFEFGSTVIVLFEKGRVDMRKFRMDTPLKLGEKIGVVS